MRPLRNIIAVLIVVMILSVQGWSQTFDLRFVVMQNNGTNYDVKIQINANGSPFNLGTSSLIFTYNTADLANPTLLTIHGYSGGNYLPMVINATQPPRVAVNIELGIAPGLAVPLSPTDVATIRFTTLNPAGMSNLQWVTGGGAPTVVFKDDEATVVPPESLISLNTQPLPVQLASFTATVVNGIHVRLDWRTISEINNYGFYVERKRTTDSAFAEIPNSFVPGHGTTNEPHEYTFTDTSPGAATVWYRLRQVDLDGTRHYTEPIMATGILVSVQENGMAPIEFSLKQNSPNPFNPSTEIEFSVEKLERTTLEVFNIIGQRVATLFDDVAEPGRYYKVRFDGANLASGMYLYRLQSGNKSEVKKLLLLK